MGHLWSTIIHDNAMQMHAFQRVVAKKEDPTTHEKFLDVLKRVENSPPSSHSSNPVSYATLATGQLLELFWHRLSMSLSEVASEKIKAYPVAASRAYPYLRKSAISVLENLKTLTERDIYRDFHSGSSSASSFLPTKEFTESLFVDHQAANNIVVKRRDTGYMFGSLQWSQNDLLSTLDMGSMGRISARSHYNRTNAASGNSLSQSLGRRNTSHNSSVGISSSDISDSTPGVEHSLVAGFKPMKDRFLLNSLNRMTAPIMQMFPEVEGYTGICFTLFIKMTFSNGYH